MRVLVIGLDGACMDLIEHWANEGKLPTFKKLMSEGAYGKLESIIPTLSIPAWNCLTTGKNPGKIGCFSFLQKAYKSYDFHVYSAMVKKERNVWDILSDYGKKVFVFNPINILSAYRINGWMVAGCLCPSEERLTYPKGLKKELYEMGYENDIGDFKTVMTLTDKQFYKKNREITEKYFNIVRNFFLKKDWDFGFFVINELDRLQHRFWNKKSIILKLYQNIDTKLSKILSELDDETTVIVVSDHGFRANKRIFLINEWLMRKGYLKVKEMTVSEKAVKIILYILRRPLLLKMLRPMMRRSYLLQRLHYTLFQTIGRIPIIWEETRAFSSPLGAIYINMRNREPRGIVAEEEYEKLREEIIEELRKISVKAHKGEELYCGEYMKLSPDIVIEIDENTTALSSRLGYGKIFLEGEGGNHCRENGIFFAYGPDIKNKKINAKIYDIAPTILHMFGIPIPKEMDGRVLEEIFVPKSSKRVSSFLSEKERIRKKVRMLTYRRGRK